MLATLAAGACKLVAPPQSPLFVVAAISDTYAAIVVVAVVVAAFNGGGRDARCLCLDAKTTDLRFNHQKLVQAIVLLQEGEAYAIIQPCSSAKLTALAATLWHSPPHCSCLVTATLTQPPHGMMALPCQRAAPRKAFC